jgi:hypothetical protein
MRKPLDPRAVAARELFDLLQRAHFAARRLEDCVPVDRANRLVDHIHAVRLAAMRYAQTLPEVA